MDQCLRNSAQQEELTKWATSTLLPPRPCPLGHSRPLGPELTSAQCYDRPSRRVSRSSAA
jgi:hypothetical protein